MLGQEILAHAGFVVKAVQRCLGCDLYEIAIALFVLGQHQQMVIGVAFGRRADDVVIVFLADIEFAADDGLDAVLVGRVYEMHCTENISVVGHGDGGHAKFSDTLAKLIDIAGAIEQRVIGMQVQVNELGSGVQFHFRWRHSNGKERDERALCPQNEAQKWKTGEALLTFIGAGHTEFYAVIVIRLGGRGKIEFRERNLLRMLWVIRHHLSNDGVVSYFLLVLITENEHGRRVGSFRALGLAWRRRRGARIYILVGLLAHLLFREALLVHLIGQADLILLILIGRRSRSPTTSRDRFRRPGKDIHNPNRSRIHTRNNCP